MNTLKSFEKSLLSALLALIILMLTVSLPGCTLPSQKVTPGPVQQDYENLHGQVANYLRELPGTYTLYFKDLDSGQKFGIREDEPIPPASSIKLPVVLYLYREVAAGRRNWKEKVRYEAAADYQEGAGILRY